MTMPVYSNWHERVWLHHSKAQEMHTYLGFRTETARRKGCLFELHELKCHLQETQRDDCPHLVMDFTPWTFNRHSGTKEEAELLGSKIGCSLLGTPLAAAPHLTVRFRRPTDNYSPTQEEDCFWSTLLKTGCFKATSITLKDFPGGLPKTLLTVQREFGPIKKFHLSAPYAQRRNFTYVLQSGMGLRQNEVETLFAIIAANRYSMKELTLRNLMFYDQATTTEFLEAVRPLQRMIAISPEIDTLNIEPPWYYYRCNDTLRTPSWDRRNGLVEVNAYHVGHMDRGRQGERYARIKLLTAPMKVPVTSVGYQTWANLLVNSAPRLDDIYNLVRERPEFLSSLADTVLGDPSFQKVEMKKALREPPRKDDYEMPQVICSRRIRRNSPSWYGFYVRGPRATLHLGQSEITDSRLPLEESLDRLTVHCSYEEISVYPDEDGWDDPANYSSFFGNADQEDVNVVKKFLRAIIGKGTKKFEIGFGKGDHEFEDFRIAAILRMLPARLEHLVIRNIDATHPKVFATLRRFRNLRSLRLIGPPENFMGHLHFVKLHPNCDILIYGIKQVLRSLRKSQSLESFTIYNLPMERLYIDSEGCGPYQYNKDQIDEDSARVRWLHGDRKQILGRIEKELVKHLHLKFVRLKVCVYVDQIDKYFPMESRLNGHCSRQLKTPTCEPRALLLKGNKTVPEPETSMIWMPKTRTNGSKRPPASVPASSEKKPRANKPAIRLKRPPDSSPTLPTKKPCYRTVASLDTRTPAPSLKRNADVAGAALPAPRSFENSEQSSQPSEQSSKPSVLDIKERAILNIKPKEKVHETGLTPSDLYTADILEWMFVKEVRLNLTHITMLILSLSNEVPPPSSIGRICLPVYVCPARNDPVQKGHCC